MEDILIDIFVGRDPRDFAYLNLAYQHHHSRVMAGQTLASAVNGLTTSAELRSALMICTEGSRDLRPVVDQSRVILDVAKIEEIMDMTFPRYQTLFDILLRRSDPHIAQINVYYKMRTGMDLDEALRRSLCLSEMTRKIAVHAVRTATDLTYRDVMLLRDAKNMNEKLGIRVCRMHWHKQHWKQIKAVHVGHGGKEFSAKWKGKNSLFGDLIVSMAAA